MATLPPNLKLTRDGLTRLLASLREMADKEILVGFPMESTERDPEPGEDSSPITNAALGYIHNTGMPEQNIPQREFMEAGIREAREAVTDGLTAIARAIIVQGANSDLVERYMHRIGSVAETALKDKINEGVPPPLADSTLRERAARGRKGAKMELERRAAGEDPSTEHAKPLIDTAQLRNALKYVIRSRSDRN